MRTPLIGLIVSSLLMMPPAVGPGMGGQQASETRYEKATFAGGCFWCMEPPFDELPGVVSTTSGYTGGRTKNPTYEEVSAGHTGHAEAVEILYDPAKIGYARLLDVFWKNIDPLTPNRQFCDVGTQYRAAGRGVPPELLQEESDPLQVLQVHVRPRTAARAALGRIGTTTGFKTDVARGRRHEQHRRRDVRGGKEHRSPRADTLHPFEE